MELCEPRHLMAGLVPQMVLDINPTGDAAPAELTQLGNHVFFSADDGTGRELWMSDGTAGGTQKVIDLSTTGGSDPVHLTVVGDEIWFGAYGTNSGSGGLEIWRTDGTNTTRVHDFGFGVSAGEGAASLGFDEPEWKAVQDGSSTWRLAVVVNTNFQGENLYISNSTANGFNLIEIDNIASGGKYSDPLFMEVMGGALYVTADDGSLESMTWPAGPLEGEPMQHWELWKVGGSFNSRADATRMYDPTGPSASTLPGLLTDVGGGKLVFGVDRVWAGSSGVEVYVTDGLTPGDSGDFKRLFNGSASSSVGEFGDPEFTSVSGTLFFTVSEPANGAELWYSNMTTVDGAAVLDLQGNGATGSNPVFLGVASDDLYLATVDDPFSVTGIDVWKVTPGTPPTKTRLADFGPVSSGGDGGITYLGTDGYGAVFGDPDFLGVDPLGIELWRTPLAGGDLVPFDINPGPDGSDPEEFLNVNNLSLFFTATNGTDGRELWTLVEFVPPELEYDFGDAPDPTFPTLLANNGASHVIESGFHLGGSVDAEVDGQPHPYARGDDLAGEYDEYGVNFVGSPEFPGDMGTLTVTLTDTSGEGGYLDAWIDFDGSGSWDVDEQIAASIELDAGANEVDFAIPIDASVGYAMARFRLSRDGGLSPAGLAPNGEVEDYTFFIKSETLDFGDAPEPYPTYSGENGAVHTIVPDFNLGATVDRDFDGQPNADATGDDNNMFYPPPAPTAQGDEDGVSFDPDLVLGASIPFSISVTDPGDLEGFLDAWIDWNRDGDWDDAGEQVATSLPVVDGLNNLNVDVPSDASIGITFARFRLSTTGGLDPRGYAADGEVEDYMFTVYASQEAATFAEQAQRAAVQWDFSENFVIKDSLYENFGGWNERWIYSSTNLKWYFITPFGQLYRWQGGTNATSVQVAQLSPEHYLNPLSLTSASEIYLAANPGDEASLLSVKLDQTYRFQTVTNDYFNWGGANERWLQDQAGLWYFIKPDGGLFKLVGGSVATSQQIAQLSVEQYNDLSLLYGAEEQYIASIPDNAPLLSAVEVDQELGLKFNGSYYSTTGGLNAKWMYGALGKWYFLTSDGSLYQWTGSYQLSENIKIARVDPALHATPALLHDAYQPSTQLIALDTTLQFVTRTTYTFNWGGLQEKWLLSSTGAWYYIKPNGELYSWSGGSKADVEANSTLIATLSLDVYHRPHLLTDAAG